MTIDESTSLRSQSTTLANTAEHGRLLRAIIDQLERVTARVDALEAHAANDSTAPTAGRSRPSTSASTSRQAGWQPARR